MLLLHDAKAQARGLTPGSRRRKPTLGRLQGRTALLFVLPQVIGLLAFTAVPLLASLGYSFTHWDLVAPSPNFVGLSNWRYLFTDVRIPAVLWNTVRFILIGTTTFLVFSLVAALLTFTPRRFVGLYRAALFLPYVLSQIAVGVVWRWMFNTESGPLSRIWEIFGGKGPDWLLDPATAMPSIAMVTTWQTVGYGMTLYIAALQGVPMTLLEAATIDGAGRLRRFWHVTLPTISPTVLFLTVTSLIAAFQLFDPVVAMTSASVGSAGPAAAGGPSNSTRTIVLYMYNQMFNYNERISGLGYAAALAWMLALLIFAVTAMQFLIGRRLIHFEDRTTLFRRRSGGRS
jgi:multiple sugar transport system permease protein